MSIDSLEELLRERRAEWRRQAMRRWFTIIGFATVAILTIVFASWASVAVDLAAYRIHEVVNLTLEP